MKGSEALLRRLIKEVITVTIQRPGAKAIEKQIEDDHEDELIWFVDKYGHKVHSKGTVGAANQLRDIALDLAWTTQLPRQAHDAWADRLVVVVTPWGRDGFDALRRIKIATERTGKPFPFFEYSLPKDAVGLVTPKTPDPATVRFLRDVQPRIGRNDTGKGEFVLALMTGGIAGGEGHGDLTIDGKSYEVKDEVSPGSPIRLGDDVSKRFVSALRDKVEGKLPEGVDFVAFISELDAPSFMEELRESNKHIASLVDEVLVAEMKEGIESYVFLQEGGHFDFVPADYLHFYNITPSLRVHVFRDEREVVAVAASELDVWPEFKGAAKRKAEAEEVRRAREKIDAEARRAEKERDALKKKFAAYETALADWESARDKREAERAEHKRRAAAGEKGLGKMPEKFSRLPPKPPAGYVPPVT